MSQTKYIFVTGGVTSSLGKGIIAASLAKLLQARGYKTTIQKLDPYINVDPGTLDPSQLRLRYSISGANHIEPTRISAYAQYSKKFYWGENRMFVNAGVRASHWDFNDETIISPRAQIAIKPNLPT